MPLSDDDIRRLRQDTVGDETFAHRFEILREHASGGMCRVFEGTDRETGMRVAIKLLLGGEDRVRFAGEADTLERLDHPNIVKYIRHGENREGVPYLAMEWLDGETLAKRLDRGPLSVLEAVTIGGQLAAAFEYLHREGVIHRDLKPSNIYLVGGDVAQAKLIDLGIAKTANQDLTQSGQILGTPGYMAPEQARGDKDADARIDLFALGCVLYESLAGRPPFEGTAVMEVLARLLLETPLAIETIAKAVPPRLGELIAKLLAKDPDDRVADATVAFTELAAIRRAIIDGDVKSLTRVSSPQLAREVAPTVRERPAPRRRLWWLWKIVLPVIGSIILVLVGIVMLVRWQNAKCEGGKNRYGCKAQCASGNAKACELYAEAMRVGMRKIPRDLPATLASYVRGCELRDVGVCTRGVLMADEMLARKELTKEQIAPPVDRLLTLACEQDDMPSCFQLGLRHTPGINTLEPDPARAYAHTIKACTGKVDAACNHLTTMIDAAIGDDAQRDRALAVRDEACKRGVILCGKGTLVVAEAVGTETAPDGDQGEDAAARKQVDKLVSMAAVYVDPCWPDSKLRHFGTALEDTPRGAAWRELGRFRNVMGCKHIKVDHVPNWQLSNDFHRADKLGDYVKAKQIATQLVAQARKVVVDRALVDKRLAEATELAARRKVKAGSRLAALLADVKGELAAGRVEAANLVVDHLMMELINN